MIGSVAAVSVVLVLGWLLLNLYGFGPKLHEIGLRRAAFYAAIWGAIILGLTLIVLWGGIELN
ncbi:MAG: hypothetical protein M0R03_11740 [Novosphingobium sp.]|nr:hypothetical protein [Novosphingobium sp.]